MMLRATVTDTDPRDPTRVWVTIPQKYGTKPVRVFTRVQVTKGDHVYVTNTSVTRVPQWVVLDHQTEIGRWGNPYPHTHPLGQVYGLVDWVSQYEAWTKDHQARLDAADKQIADSKLVVAQTRKDLDQAQTDIADAVRKATVEQARLDQAEANLDQMGRNLLAAGGRISANETALADSQKRLESAETAVQKAQEDLGDGSGLAAKVAGFLTVSAMTGVFTKSLTAQDATLLGATVAETLNVTGMLRGRDAILDGTVDVAQLNVTGEMSAKIISTATLQARQGFFTDGLTAQDAALLGTTVAEKLVVTDAFSARVVNAMTAETKNLVVTDDAILNKATVIQSLVTPELIAQKADIRDLASRMITSGLLQTNPAANRGVKVDNNGIRAWDDAGRQTVNLNGKANYITGTFATAEKEQRVEIKSGGSVAAADFYGSGNTVDHLGVWHQADQGDATASRIISQHGLTRVRENPGMVMWPFRGDFGFTGRWARNTDTVKMFSLVNYKGLPGGGWVDLVFTYPTPFPTTYSELIPVISVESRSGAECTINTRTNNADNISFRVVNKSTNPTDVMYVRGFTFNFNTVTYSTTY